MKWLIEVDGRLGAVQFTHIDVPLQVAEFLQSFGHVVTVVGVSR